MSVRTNFPANPVLNATVSSIGGNVQSTPFSLGYTFSSQAAWVIAVGSGLTATFQIMVSMDGITYENSGQVLPSVAGSASTFIAQYEGAFPFVLIQVTPSAGSGTVLIKGISKGGA
jgi:hypothetical protein